MSIVPGAQSEGGKEAWVLQLAFHQHLDAGLLGGYFTVAI